MKIGIIDYEFTPSKLEQFLAGHLRIYTNPRTGKVKLVKSKPRGKRSPKARAIRKLEYLRQLDLKLRRTPPLNQKTKPVRTAKSAARRPVLVPRQPGLLRRIAKWLVS